MVLETFISFAYATDECLDKEILRYITKEFAMNDEHTILKATNTGHRIISFVIVNNKTKDIYRLVKNKYNKNLNIHMLSECSQNDYAQCDFWTCFGASVLKQSNIKIVESGYKDIEKYGELFFNDYGVHHELMGHILQMAVEKRNFVSHKGMWIDYDEFKPIKYAYKRPKKIKIQNISSDCTEEDIRFLVFKTAVAVNMEYDYGMISDYLITEIKPNHLRTASFETDCHGRHSAVDYIIEDDMVIVDGTVLTRDCGELIWPKYAKKLFT